MANITRPRNGGFFTLEYCLVLAAVVVGFMLVARMMQGTLQGSFRRAADTIGFGQQYDPNTTAETLRGYPFDASGANP